MNNIYFGMDAKVFFQRNALSRHLPMVGRYGKKVLLVSGRHFIFRSGLYDKITGILADNGIESISFGDVEPEPDTSNVEKGAAIAVREGCDCILAVGGGSAMDVGKVIALLARNKGVTGDYFGEREYENAPLPIIAVPTTCGTGSEVTRFAVIIDRNERTKKTVSSELIIPRLSILDAEVLRTLPVELVMATGMDAFSHSAESFLSIKSDYISRLFAKESIRLLCEFLPAGYRNPDNIEAREKILLASLLAGFSINRTGTIIVHGMGYSITIKHNVHHGTANALFLPYVFEYLKDNGYGGEIEELETIWGDTAGLKEFVAGIGLPNRLRNLGIVAGELDDLADLCVAATQRALKNMKFKMNRNDYRKLLERAL